MAGGPVEIDDRRLLHDHAAVDHRHPVGHGCHDGQVVGDEQHPHPALAAHVVDEVEHGSGHGDVEARQRLVGDEHSGRRQQGGCEHRPLRLPLRHLVRPRQERAPLRELHLAEGVGDPALDLLPRQALVALDDLAGLRPDDVDRVPGGHGVLEQDTDPLTHEPLPIDLIDLLQHLALEHGAARLDRGPAG